MPVLRDGGNTDRCRDIWLNLCPGHDGRVPPITIGSAADSPSHAHLPDLSPDDVATIVGSRVSSAYAFVLRGAHAQINGRRLHGLRVLRHGDQLRLGGHELLYLDFAFERLTADSRRIGGACGLAACPERPARLARGDEVIACPWCGAVFHSPCWMQLAMCSTAHCYPVRRMLLAEVGRPATLERLRDGGLGAARTCTARCGNPVLTADEGILRCPGCAAPYHPGCWLSMRAPCVECRYDLAGLIERRVLKTAGSPAAA